MLFVHCIEAPPNVLECAAHVVFERMKSSTEVVRYVVAASRRCTVMSVVY